jgi:signal transduction histidine kinase
MLSPLAGGSMSSVPTFAKWGAGCRLERSDVWELHRLLQQQSEELSDVKRELLEQEPLAMIGEMAQFISHDIRHHLSAVYAGVEFMSNAKVRQTDREELSQDVDTAIHTMTGLLDSLLLFAESGRSLNPHWGSVNLLIRHAVDSLRSHPDAAEVEILFQDRPPSVEDWIDCKRLGSAIYNLMLNACQAAKRGLPPRRVEIALSQDQSLIQIRVTDTGPGVPESMRETLFQPFVSGGDGKGIGLGLTIAQRGVRDHGGMVCLEESRPRRTIFGLHLPRAALRSLAAESAARVVVPRRQPKQNSPHAVGVAVLDPRT